MAKCFVKLLDGHLGENTTTGQKKRAQTQKIIFIMS